MEKFENLKSEKIRMLNTASSSLFTKFFLSIAMSTCETWFHHVMTRLHNIIWAQSIRFLRVVAVRPNEHPILQFHLFARNALNVWCEENGNWKKKWNPCDIILVIYYHCYCHDPKSSIGAWYNLHENLCSVQKVFRDHFRSVWGK